uniref:cysteine desulfurase n=1 Tax=Chelydra serpentina TaxID=8475 RepID=A0A8C3XS15_CHESE
TALFPRNIEYTEGLRRNCLICDPRVLDSMLPYLMHYYGNPHSRTHAYGWESESAMERARQQVASLIGADPREIIFTSGATESNNLAIKGVARFYKSRKKHIITTQTEHKCVLDSCRYLEAEGFRVTYLPVKRNGLIDLKELEDALQPDTSLVSIMTVNNEIGVKQPISDIGQICSSRKVFFHSDAAQAVGKIPMDVNDMKIDLMSISGHKIYGPKGVGAIYIRRRPRVRLEPLQSGGGQERGMRSGTVPTPLAVGLGAACEVSQQEMEVYGEQFCLISASGAGREGLSASVVVIGGTSLKTVYTKLVKYQVGLYVYCTHLSVRPFSVLTMHVISELITNQSEHKKTWYGNQVILPVEAMVTGAICPILVPKPYTKV